MKSTGITAACMVPHPPLIVPDVGRGEEKKESRRQGDRRRWRKRRWKEDGQKHDLKKPQIARDFIVRECRVVNLPNQGIQLKIL